MISKKISFLMLVIVLTNLTTSWTAHATSLVADSKQDKNNSELFTESTSNYELTDELLQSAKNTINELNEASQVTQVMVDDKEVYIYNSSSAILSQTNTPVPTTPVYTNRWIPQVNPQRKRVPESSSLFGLVFVAGLSAGCLSKLINR